MSGGRRRSKDLKHKSRLKAHRGQAEKAIKKRRVRSRMARGSRRRNRRQDRPAEEAVSVRILVGDCLV